MRVVVLDDDQGVAAELADWPSGPDWSVAFEHERLPDADAVVSGLAAAGRLGSRMVPVPVGRAFGMGVPAWSTNLTAEAAAEAGAVRCDKDELFRRSDVVSLHLVLSERSPGPVGREELALLGPQGYLVTTSQAGLVDRDAPLAALHEGTIAGAALHAFAAGAPVHVLAGPP